MIKSILGFKLGEHFMYDGNLFVAVKFPTRHTVCGTLVHRFIEPCLRVIRVSILETWRMPEINTAIKRAKAHRKEWLLLSTSEKKRVPRAPKEWWRYHHQNCGTVYRGCHPTACPKDVFEKTGKWIGEIDHNV